MNLRSILLSSALLPHLACSTAVIELDTEGQTAASTSATDGGTTSTSTATASDSGTGASAGTGTAAATGPETTNATQSDTAGTTGATGGTDGTTGGTDDTTGTTGTTTEGTTSGTTDGTTSTTDATTGGLACADLDEKACAADPACMVIAGAPIDIPNACTKPLVFLECADAMICGDAITYACPEGTKEVHQFLDTCIPAGFVLCDPVKVNGACK